VVREGRQRENIIKTMLVLLAMVMLSGCMTFNEAMLRKVHIPKQAIWFRKLVAPRKEGLCLEQLYEMPC
jgi:hypothetical protein